MSAIYDRIQESFARQGFMAHLGARLTLVEEGRVTIEMPCADEVSQQHGFVHAGAVATILDSACGYAALAGLDDGDDVITIEYKINLLRPAVGERVIATGETVRAGKRIVVARGEARMDPSAEPVAVMQATIMRLVP